MWDCWNWFYKYVCIHITYNVCVEFCRNSFRIGLPHCILNTVSIRNASDFCGLCHRQSNYSEMHLNWTTGFLAVREKPAFLRSLWKQFHLPKGLISFNSGQETYGLPVAPNTSKHTLASWLPQYHEYLSMSTLASQPSYVLLCPKPLRLSSVPPPASHTPYNPPFPLCSSGLLLPLPLCHALSFPLWSVIYLLLSLALTVSTTL